MKRWFVACAAVSWAGAVLACGTCVEDKIAATYDHAVVESAARAGKVMVYCEVQGRAPCRRCKRDPAGRVCPSCA